MSNNRSWSSKNLDLIIKFLMIAKLLLSILQVFLK
jgi:hypothetical protein